MKQKIKLKVACWLYEKFPRRFCWAELVSWSYSKKIFPTWDKKNEGDGCKQDSEKKYGSCYCGCWVNGKNSRDKDFELPDYLKNNPETENKIPF